MTQHGHFHWNELMTRNLEQTRAFYHDALGWEFDTMDMPGGGTYLIAMDAQIPVCGIFEMSGTDFDGVSDHWLSYIAVDDIDKRLEKASAGGATVTREPWDVPGVGRIAMLQEPGGAQIGWMTPAAND